MQVESALPCEKPEEICARVFRQLRPRTPPPEIRVRFCAFAGARSSACLKDGRLELRVTDLLEGAPAPVLEALFFLLLGKLYRRQVPRQYAHRYRSYWNRQDMQRRLHLMRQIRGRKFVSGPRGAHYNLEEIFEDLNQRFFHGLMARPLLGWSRTPSRTNLGHWDPSHNAIIISRALDDPALPRLLVEYVLFHEMLHLRFPARSRGGRRQVHTREFREAERAFPQLDEARRLLKRLAQS